MTDMIERVARALAEYYEDDRFERCIPQAILAIKAIREPSEEMKAVVAGDWGRRTWEQYGQVIDAALKGTEQ